VIRAEQILPGSEGGWGRWGEKWAKQCMHIMNKRKKKKEEEMIKKPRGKI
jgi:hypothetical protein